MRLLILFISFLISQVADSQIISASPPYRVRASGCSYLLDTYPGAAAAYSLRKLDADYAGSAIRVRRSSDNTESDIGFTGTCGDLDTASLKTFVGTGGTDDGFVVTWYDQSGNSRDAAEATAGNQPKIMDNGVVYRLSGLPSVYFTSGSDNILTATFSGFAITSHSIFSVFSASAGKSFGRVVSFRQASTQDYERYCPIISNGATYTNIGAYESGFKAGRTTSTTLPNLYAAINDGVYIKNSVNNGSEATSAYALSITVVSYTIGASALTTGAKNDGNITGYVSEVVCYPSDQTSNRSNINGNINTYYSIY